MKKTLALCATILSTFACAHTGHESTTAADGQPAYQTSCHGEASDACLTEASQTCGGKYAVIDQESMHRSPVKNGGVSMDAGSSDVKYVTYRCDTVAH